MSDKIREELGLNPEQMREEIHDKCHLIGGMLMGMAVAFSQENLAPVELACATVDAIHVLAGAFLIADVLDLEGDLVDHLYKFVEPKIVLAMEEMAKNMTRESHTDEIWPDLVGDKDG